MFFIADRKFNLFSRHHAQMPDRASRPLRKDLINAGAHWVDEAVVENANLIISRKPADLDVFCEAVLKRL